LLLAAAVLAVTAGGRAADAPPAPVVTTVMKFLDSPRGLAFGPGGALFVAEAGLGKGTTPCTGVTGVNCYGLTGSVSRLLDGDQVRVVTGLPSISNSNGGQARGPHDIALRFGGGWGSSALGVGGAHVTIGFEGDPDTRAAVNRPDVGKLVHIPAPVLLAPSDDLCTEDCWTPVVDIAAYERGGGPDPRIAESDPYGLLVERRRGHGGDEGIDDRGPDENDDDAAGTADVVVDASGNSLLRVDEDGEISLLGVFPSRGTTPPRATDSVPTSVVRGSDGAYYVGELVGTPFTGLTRQRSNVYRIVPGQDPYAPTVFLDGKVTGLNAIIDMAFQGDDLYIVEHWTVSPTATPRDGKLVRLRCGGRPLVCDSKPETILAGLDGPTSVAFGPDGALYVTNHGAGPAFVGGVYTPAGEVLRIEMPRGHGHP
jgi:hypothetical protein